MPGDYQKLTLVNRPFDLQGWASRELRVGQSPTDPSMAPLLDAILEHVPSPPGDPNGVFAMLVTMTERDSFLGRVATGRIASGQIKVGDRIKVLRHSGRWFCIPQSLRCCSRLQACAFAQLLKPYTIAVMWQRFVRYC